MAVSSNRQCRGGVRPIAGVLLFAAAAAGLWFFLRTPEAPPAVVVPAADFRAAAADAARPANTIAPPESGSAASMSPVNADVPSLESGQAETSSVSYKFTIAVERPDYPADDPETIRAFASIHARFLAALRQAPHLRLIEFDPADEEFDPADYDFVFKPRGQLKFEPDAVWAFTVSWEAPLTDDDGGWSDSRNAATSPDVDTVGREAAEALLRFPLPPTESRLTELEALAMDPTLTDDARYDAIEELQQTPERYAFVGVDAERLVSEAAVAIVNGALEPEIRARVWRAMREAGIEDSYLMTPLIDSVLSDPSDDVRLEAIQLLARTFKDDASAYAAIQYMQENDPSAEVKTHAKWEMLDTEGRRDYVDATLMNDELPMPDRAELLVAGLSELPRFIDIDLATRLLNGLSMESDRALSVPADRAAAARVIPLLLSMLTDERNDGLRMTAFALLVPYADDPVVRGALDRTIAGETAFMRRIYLQRALEGR
jgi:hypothetical protein